MSRNKVVLAVMALAAIIGFGCQVQAQTIEVIVAGSSAQWQTMALGTYNNGLCGTGLAAKAPCFHYTYNSFNLTDSRVSPANVDTGAVWIVWDSTTPKAKVWAFVKVDSGVGIRCYFANSPCTLGIPSVPAPNQQISSALWGADTALPTASPDLTDIFQTGTGTPVTVAATDIRPEDSLWSTCRTNSQAGMNAFDTTDGLGYNANNNPGVCATTKAGGLGSAIKSGYPSSTSTANVLAFNITGTDPITGNNVRAYTTYSVGAAPIAFIFSQNGGQLAGLTNVTEAQVQQAFSGAKCDADVFGLASNPIAVYLREPLSGTMNTTEATVFRRPVVALGGSIGLSQETGVNGANPLTGGVGGSVACPDDGSTGKGGRWRGIGTGEVVKSVLNSKHNNGIDGITYTFFSYGNVSSVADGISNVAYATLNGVDPIFLNYNTTSGPGFDPGQPASGKLPSATDTPCGSFPCPENQIWALQGLSFPNVRNGSYRAWSLLRVVSTGTPLLNIEKVIKASQQFVVSTIPDYIPAVSTKVGTFTDPGLTLVRSHYQQVDGTGLAAGNIGVAPVNSGTGERGGDMGGCILYPNTNASTQLIQAAPGGACASRATF